MINQVLQEIKRSGSTVSLDDLSRRLRIEPSALEGMLEYCVQKGILRTADETPGEDGCAHGAGHCGSGCAGYSGCPFIARMPKVYSLVEGEKS